MYACAVVYATVGVVAVLHFRICVAWQVAVCGVAVHHKLPLLDEGHVWQLAVHGESFVEFGTVLSLQTYDDYGVGADAKYSRLILPCPSWYDMLATARLMSSCR